MTITLVTTTATTIVVGMVTVPAHPKIGLAKSCIVAIYQAMLRMMNYMIYLENTVKLSALKSWGDEVTLNLRLSCLEVRKMHLKRHVDGMVSNLQTVLLKWK